jgi:hypothetical protein
MVFSFVFQLDGCVVFLNITNFLIAKITKVIRKIIPSIETIGNSRDSCKLIGKGAGQINSGL